jgi:hypothetical protein
MSRAGAAAGAIALSFAAVAAIACGRSLGAQADGGTGVSFVTAPSTVAPGAPRAGMVWIPAGVLRAGSAVDEVPRVADAELAAVELPLGGFYIDVLPWPNEQGAIPTTNVSRQEAALLCDGKGKRLCTELEWERACKGPDNGRYEYGGTYDPRTCNGGQPADTAARHPSGERSACRSAFGVREMHGGAWEWTDSTWNRGALGRAETPFGVVRGGDDANGEIATRCAFAKAAAPGGRSPATGFRCCAGPRNEAQVQLEVKTGAAFEKTVRPSRSSPPLDALDGTACGPPLTPTPCFVSRAWTWRPTPNVELSLAGGCIGHDPNARCAVAVSRTVGERVDTLAQVDTGREIPEVVLVEGNEHRIRVRGADIHGQYFREVIFSYGRVDVKEVH